MTSVKVDENKIPKESTEAPEHKTKRKRKKVIWLFTIGLLLLGLAFVLLWLFYLRFHRWTDDAYANGNLININSAISGSVVSFFADDTDLVKEDSFWLF